MSGLLPPPSPAALPSVICSLRQTDPAPLRHRWSRRSRLFPRRPRPSRPPPVVRPHLTNGDYTAPGAPRIAIHEESAPVMRRVNRTVPTPDPEATQEARTRPLNRPSRTNRPCLRNRVTTRCLPRRPPRQMAATTLPLRQATTPRRLRRRLPHPPTRTLSMSASRAMPSPARKAAARPSFGFKPALTPMKVRLAVMPMRCGVRASRTSTRSERSGNHLVYKVQVGAYKSKNGASKAADDLQKKGYPAYISPIGP